MVLLYQWVPLTMVSVYLQPHSLTGPMSGMNPWLNCYRGMTLAEGGVETAHLLLTVVFPLEFFFCSLSSP